jgi:RNase P/RNase MRP subunit p29
MPKEAKVVYLEKRRDGTEFERAIRGEIIKEDDNFITIRRDDGEFVISKKVITRIEKLNDSGGVSFDGEAYR